MSSGAQKTWWVLVGLLLLSMMGMAFGAAKMMGYDPTARPQNPLVGSPAPDFELPLVSGEGATDVVSLSALRGQIVLLDFWASWCNPCRSSIPNLNQVHSRYGSRIRMYGINVDGGARMNQIRDAHQQFGAQFPSLADLRGSAQLAFDVQNIPTLVLIDRAGIIRWMDYGVPDPDEVSERIEALIAVR